MPRPTYTELLELVRRTADATGDHPVPSELGDDLLLVGSDCNRAMVAYEQEE